MANFSKSPHVFISDIEQIKSFSGNPRSRIIVGGSLMVASLTSSNAPTGFIKQEISVSKGFSISRKPEKSAVTVSMSREGLAELSARKMKAASAIDCVLKYGYSIKSSDVFSVILAFTGTYATFVAVLTFKNNSLILFSDHVLSHPSSSNFEADLQILMDRYSSDSAYGELHWAGPIEAPAGFKFVLTGMALWGFAPAALSLTPSASFMAKHGLSLAILTASAIGYAGALAIPYLDYAKYAKEMSSADPTLLKAYSGEDQLGLLKRRQAFLKVSADKAIVLDKFSGVVDSLALIDGARVSQATLTVPTILAPSAEDANPANKFDFELKIRVPLIPDQSALDQASDVIRALSESTGHNFTVVQLLDDDDKSNVREFLVQGVFSNGK